MSELWNGKHIVGEFNGFKMAVNNPDDANYITAWTPDNKNVGTLETRSSLGKMSEYLMVRNVTVNPKFRGQRIGYALYKALLDNLNPKYKGICTYLPDQANKKQVPRIWKRLGARVSPESEDYLLVDRPGVKKAKLLRRVAAPANHILVIVHPGSACGSADFEYNSKSTANAERDGLINEFNGWQGGVIVIDGALSDELPDYPQLDAALKGVLTRAKSKGLLSIRKVGDDPAQIEVIKVILTKLKLPKDQSYFEVTGAWAYSEIDGCVTSVYDAIVGLGYRAEISPTALTGTWGPDEYEDGEEDEDDDEG